MSVIANENTKVHFEKCECGKTHVLRDTTDAMFPISTQRTSRPCRACGADAHQFCWSYDGSVAGHWSSDQVHETRVRDAGVSPEAARIMAVADELR